MAKKRRTSSRLARKQKKTLKRQSALMIIASIGFVIIFFFVLMPRLVNLFFNIVGTGEISFEDKDQFPPQIPIISTRLEATTSSEVILSGYGEAESELVVVVNGEEQDRFKIDENGEFEIKAILTEGENLIVVYGIDEDENESETREISITVDTEAPTLLINDLEDDKQIELKKNQNLKIEGTTEVGSNLKLNDRSIYIDSEGNFSTSFYLNEGDNTLKFVVTDQAGNKIERELKIGFRY